MGKRGKQPGVGSVSGEKPGDTSKSFLTWLSANGVQHPRCTIGYLPGTGRGVVATKPIKAGDQVCARLHAWREFCCAANQLGSMHLKPKSQMMRCAWRRIAASQSNSRVRLNMLAGGDASGEGRLLLPSLSFCSTQQHCFLELLPTKCPPTYAGLAKATAVDPMQEVQGLILAVMAERYKAKASRWREYLDFIPQDMTHMPMFWKVGAQST
eukprot:1157389-Pelagomonas_calceolata.AAC.7